MGAYLNASSNLAAEMVAYRADLVLTTESEPKLADAITQLDEMEDEVNAALKRAGYAQPVTSGTSPLSFGIIAQGIKAGLAAWCYRFQGYSSEIGDLSNDVSRLEQKYDDSSSGMGLIQRIVDEPAWLPDAPRDAGGPAVPRLRGFTSLAVSDSTAVDERQFERGGEY